MLEITKEEFEAFVQKEYPGRQFKWKDDDEDSYCYIQAGTIFGDGLHYELWKHQMHLHNEIEDWRWQTLRNYLLQHITSAEICSNYWNRNWTLQNFPIQNFEDVKAAFRKMKQLMEPFISMYELEIGLFQINLEQDISDNIANKYSEFLSFYLNTGKKIKQEKQKLPYHINVIDELHINENAHSRILLKLLQFVSEKGEYEIYSSLLEYICQKSRLDSFKRIRIKKPIITQEKQRIDLWVRDKDYAIIFENKVCNANDQQEQISNYIKKTLNVDYQKYKESDIYVVYLSSIDKEPEDQSWGDFKKQFKDRYVNLSFKYDILPWLKEYVYPNIRLKDVFLQNAVAQYIDYLEGVFYLRTIQKQLNMNLNQFFYKHFKFEQHEGDYQSQVQFLQEQLDDMQAVLNKVNEYQTSIREIIFEQWRKETKELFSDLIPCEMIDDHYDPLTDVTIEIETNKPINIFIGIGNDNQLFCQVQFDNKSQKVKGTIIDAFRDLLPLSNDYCVWKYFPQHSYSDVFLCFCDVVNKFKNLKQSKCVSS